MATKTIVITSGLKRSLLQPFHGCVNLTGIRAERLKEILEPAEGGPRKRRRLTHLSTEEKLLRRKLKNRVAAQSARDRKKVLMSELEDRIALLEKENELLEKENLELRIHASDLVEENTQLRDHVTKSGALIEMSGVHSVESVAPEPSCESAAGAGSERQATMPCMASPSNQSDILLELLEQISSEVGPEGEILPAATGVSSRVIEPISEPTAEMVGSKATRLESLNELIKTDHIYFKSAQEPAVVLDRVTEVDSLSGQNSYSDNLACRTSHSVQSDSDASLKMEIPTIKTEVESENISLTTCTSEHDNLLFIPQQENPLCLSDEDLSLTFSDIESFIQENNDLQCKSDSNGTTFASLLASGTCSARDTLINLIDELNSQENDTNSVNYSKSETETMEQKISSVTNIDSVESLPPASPEQTECVPSLSPHHLTSCLSPTHLSSYLSPRHNSLSDSYCSDFHSEASSPISDLASTLDDEDQWQDSFIELFPSLV